MVPRFPVPRFQSPRSDLFASDNEIMFLVSLLVFGILLSVYFRSPLIFICTYWLSFNYLRQVNEVNGGDNVFVRRVCVRVHACVRVCVCVCVCVSVCSVCAAVRSIRPV